MDQNRLSQIALHFIPGLGNFSVKQLVSYAGSAENVFKLTKARLQKIPGIGPSTADLIVKNKPFAVAEEEIQLAEKHNSRILLYTDKDFPSRLKHINDAPSLLYYRGNADFNSKKTVAIVGSRKADAYGKEFTASLMEGLKHHQALVVSGLAYGIDIEAHKAALKHGLPTIGVMASGMDIIYPSLHKTIATQMIEQGGLLTEQKFGTPPDPRKFPARNRIIAGMVDSVIIVQAAKKGGALITAEIANGYNKDVFAVPGSIHEVLSEGCNNLIKTHKAHLLTGIKDLEYIMNWERKGDSSTNEPVLDVSLLDQDERLVVLELQKHKQSIMIDNLSWQTQLPVNKLASVLLNLEFKGLVNSLPGKSYKLVKN